MASPHHAKRSLGVVARGRSEESLELFSDDEMSHDGQHGGFKAKGTHDASWGIKILDHLNA